MSTLRLVYHLALADFLERARRYSFLAMLGFVVWVGYLVNTGVISLTLDVYRGVFNSAWVGSLMTLVITTMVSLAGFYLVKNAIARDDATGVGQIIATTPMSRPMYTVGKWLSNFAVLAVIVLVLAVAAVVMQLTQRETPAFDLWALLAPLLFVALPAMSLVAAIAVLFETIRWLRGGLGNIVAFFGWTAVISLLVVPIIAGNNFAADPLGLGLFMPSMSAAAKAAYPAYNGDVSLGASQAQLLGTFVWNGINWTPGVILAHSAWVLGGLAIALLAALPFDRFDPSRERRRAFVPDPPLNAVAAPAAIPAVAMPAVALSAAGLTRATPRFNFIGLWVAELRLMLKGLRWWWYLIALGLIVAELLAPLAASRGVVLALAWIWPMLIWSPMGNREARQRTSQLIFAAPRIVLRQLAALFLAGAAVAILLGAGAGLRLLLAGDSAGLVAWLGGVLFIPSLALALGVWSGGSKLFEVLYVVLWYGGPINHAAPLDFTGASGQSAPLVFIGLALALLLAAVAGRVLALRGERVA